ncbi:MAG: PilZ domain-containing protein [Candidatus Hydrogenedentes bacterium]|nr:PilZ domain-containing protein [Candidatus Hydrogenedentota bacterium]
MTESDKRDFTRVHTHISAELTPQSGDAVSCRVEDVSISGVLLAAPGDIPRNAPCTVSLILEGTDLAVKISAHGAISRESGGLIAVEFTDMDDESYMHLRNLVLSNASDTNRVEDELDTSIGLKRHTQDF